MLTHNHRRGPLLLVHERGDVEVRFDVKTARAPGVAAVVVDEGVQPDGAAAGEVGVDVLAHVGVEEGAVVLAGVEEVDHGFGVVDELVFRGCLRRGCVLVVVVVLLGGGRRVRRCRQGRHDVFT